MYGYILCCQPLQGLFCFDMYMYMYMHMFISDSGGLDLKAWCLDVWMLKNWNGLEEVTEVTAFWREGMFGLREPMVLSALEYFGPAGPLPIAKSALTGMTPNPKGAHVLFVCGSQQLWLSRAAWRYS